PNILQRLCLSTTIPPRSLTGCGENLHVRDSRRILPRAAQKARPARPFQFSLPLFMGAAKAALYCAHRTSTVSPCAFCEQEGHLAALPPAGGLFQHPVKTSQLGR